MAQDKFNLTSSGSRMARIRASRLTKSPNTETVQDTDPSLIISEGSPVIDAETGAKGRSQKVEPGPEAIEDAPAQTMPIGETIEAVPAEGESFYEANEEIFAEKGPVFEQALDKETKTEDQPTLQLPALPAKDHLPLPETLPDLQVVSPYTVEDQPTRQLQSAAFNSQDVESQQTQQLPASLISKPQSVETQQTRQLPAISGAIEVQKEAVDTQLMANISVSSRHTDGIFAAIRRIVSIGLARLQEPQPEGQFTRGLRVLKPGISLGLFPLLTLTNAFGLILISISYYLGNFGVFSLEFSFLLGLLLIFVPNVLRLLSPATLRTERIYLLCGLGLAFYLIAFMMSPLHIFSFDEFLHWVTADTIAKTRHLFSDNSMLPVSPYYPGLEIITNAISSLTGLSTFYASIPLIIATRIVMILALFLFYEQITQSSRMAGIATVIYMTNPHFIFFDAMYSYETLALPLTICAFYILARYENIGGENRWMIFTSWIVLIAITFSHHMTDYVFTGLLILWAAVSFFCASPRKIRIHLTSFAVFGIVLAIAYAFLLNGNPVWGYLSSYFTTAFSELGNILTGTSASRPLFTSTSAAPSPIWDRLLMMGSVALVAFALPFGLLTLWRLHRRNALAMMLGIFALAYPIAQAFRFTSLGPEIADRSTAFLFLAVAYVLTVLITHFWPTRKLSRRTIALITCTLSVILLGGIILDAGAGFTNLPGPYAVGADGRSVEPEGINAALWTLSYLGPDNRIGTDRTNQMLMSTYGDQRVVTELDDLIDVSPIFYSTQFDAADQGLLNAGRVKFLIVDMRLSTATPVLGFYFVSDEPEANHITAPISNAALTKFDSVPQINRLFDSGDIVIYDTGAFVTGPGS